MITIIDYGLGNIKAFVNVYNRLNIKTKIAQKASDIEGASKIILPGVGAFDYAISQLNNSGMRDEIEKKVLINRIPIMGICVGMQILAKSSDEGTLPGLGWINGKVKKFETSINSPCIKLPHMGWNTIKPVNNSPLMIGFSDTSRFYFLHSYYFIVEDKKNIISTTNYSLGFSSGVSSDNIFGIQFHPEKSHANGIRLLQNFANN
jgi:imidazole glycerol-phosphate synthase subunit HisH